MVESLVYYCLSRRYNIISPNHKDQANLNYICATNEAIQLCPSSTCQPTVHRMTVPSSSEQCNTPKRYAERHVNGGLLQFSQIPRSSERHCPGGKKRPIVLCLENTKPTYRQRFSKCDCFLRRNTCVSQRYFK